jgi:hypothetical protein
LSGTVTSSTRIALSWHGPEAEADTVPSGVPGVCAAVVDEAGVSVDGVSVGRDKPGFVGGRVDVMKTDLVGAGVSSETLTQESRLVSRINIHRIGIQIFFIMGILLGKY